MSRADLVDRIAALAGPEVIQVEDRADGWPGLARVRLAGEATPVAMHVGAIGRSGRKRDDRERRFQNPSKGRPLGGPPGYLTLLIGLWEEGARPVIAGMDVAPRVGRETRQSFFAPLHRLQLAARLGWAEHVTTKHERIICFLPALLPMYVEERRSAVEVPPSRIIDIAGAAGIAGDLGDPVEQRLRRAASALVRSAQFSREVLDAYGSLCAMCGLDLGLIEGAHIYPVEAGDSPDATWNGLALCANHHCAFDRHLIWVDPLTRSLRLRPDLIEGARVSRSANQFLETTFPELTRPASASATPRAEMFEKRYAFYDDRYAWAKKRT